MTKRPPRRPARQWPPKGSYPHPAGGYITPTTRGRRIHVTGHLKAEPDMKRLAEAAVELADHLRRIDDQGRSRRDTDRRS